MREPSLRDQLLADYDRLEDAIDRVAVSELWALGDWLAEFVPTPPPGPKGVSTGVLRLSDLAGRRGRSQSWLNTLRRTAKLTEPDRLPQITPRVYAEALRVSGGDLMAANHSLVTKGHRLRDQAGKMESPAALHEGLRKRTPEEREEFLRVALRDPVVREILGDEDPSNFGAEWSDLLVVRVSETAAKLTARVKREGLRFSPGADLGDMFELLLRAEHQIADVRAAVQERVQDESLEVGDAN